MESLLSHAHVQRSGASNSGVGRRVSSPEQLHKDGENGHASRPPPAGLGICAELSPAPDGPRGRRNAPAPTTGGHRRRGWVISRETLAESRQARDLEPATPIRCRCARGAGCALCCLHTRTLSLALCCDRHLRTWPISAPCNARTEAGMLTAGPLVQCSPPKPNPVAASPALPSFRHAPYFADASATTK